MDQEFINKVALVTGGSRGIGREISLALGRAGAMVAVNYLKNEAAAHSTITEIKTEGGTAHMYQANVSDQSEIEAMVKNIEQSLGPIDILVTNAGISHFQHHRDLTFKDYRKVMETNVDGTFLPIMSVKDQMIAKGGGNIVCISSIAGLRARPKLIPYSISKAAVIGLVRSFAAALGPEVRVNSVAPGLIQTDMTENMDPTLKTMWREEAFLKKLGEPKDISEAVLFLLSDRAGFISGQTFSVDGGRVTLP